MTAEVMPSPVRPEPQALHHGRVNRCGHCRAGHCKSCKGAIRVPKGRSAPSGLVVCHCPNCTPLVRCLDCGNQFSQDVNSRTWKCLDRAVCRGRIDLRHQNDRLWQLIQMCKSSGAKERRSKRMEAERVKSQVGEEPEDRVASRAPRKTTGECECCGAPTKGGRFAPGHDARLKSRLKTAAKAGDKEAYRQLVERGWVSA